MDEQTKPSVEQIRLFAIESRLETIEWLISIVLYAVTFYLLYCLLSRLLEEDDWLFFH